MLRALYERMRLIREVEEGLRREYAGRNIRGPIHLSIGQEAVAAGVLVAAEPGDVCTSTHRNHAHYLAKGGSVQGMVDELYSLETGCSGGAAGSMHLFDCDAGMWGSSAIVGGSVPVALGLALAKRLDGTRDVAIAFTGDGGTDEGSFYEALNLAALLRLPLLVVVEHNDLSTNTVLAARQARPDIVAKAAAFGVAAERVDGQDAIAVHEASRRLLAAIREEGRPRLLEAETARLCAHVGPSTSVDSPQGSYPDWARRVEREPLRALRARVRAEAPAVLADLDEIDDRVQASVDAAFEKAKGAFEAKNAVMKLVAPPPPNPNRV